MGLEQTSILTTVNNLGLLYTDLGRLNEAGEDVPANADELREGTRPQSGETYVSALNTAQNITSLFLLTGRALGAEELYGQDLLGVSAVFGRSSDSYRGLRRALDALRSN
ncbi:hypothetical protein ACMFMG_009252 [Clarireedia jacksonii]